MYSAHILCPVIGMVLTTQLSLCLWSRDLGKLDISCFIGTGGVAFATYFVIAACVAIITISY